MDKSIMAHDYIVSEIRRVGVCSIDLEKIAESWSIADAMQDEANKRKSKPELPSLQQTFINGVEQPRYAPTCEEWQPDWSQAPEWANWWAVDEDVIANWFDGKPSTSNGYLALGEALECDLAPSFNYQGNWQESLRKRPQ